MKKTEFLNYRDLTFFGCSTCAHDEKCGEIGGRQEARDYGMECKEPGVKPRYRRKRGLKPVPGDPDQCPMNARTCATCDHIEACIASTEADFKRIGIELAKE